MNHLEKTEVAVIKRLHFSLVLCVAKLSKRVPRPPSVTDEDVQVLVVAEEKLSSVVIGCRLSHLKNGPKPESTRTRAYKIFLFIQTSNNNINNTNIIIINNYNNFIIIIIINAIIIIIIKHLFL